ncbi:MAG: PAS domain S-box protein [Verrucomicrobiales bacterium]|nr:PAS domain S-box protein [Verrucomicrobiales bacterium]
MGVSTPSAFAFLIAALSLSATAAALARPATHRPRRPAPWLTWTGALALLVLGGTRLALLALDRTSPPAESALLAAWLAMTPLAAAGFLVLGLSLLAALSPRRPNLLQALTLVGVAIGFSGIEQSLFGRALLAPSITPVAAPTAWALLALQVGTLCLRTDGGFIALLLRPGPAGFIARRTIPAAILLPNAVGWIAIQAWRAGWVGLEAAVALSATALIAFLGAIAWRCSISVSHSDDERLETEGKLRESEERFRIMANDAPVLIWLSDATGQRTWFNRRWLEFVGLPSESPECARWLEFVHPDDRVRLQNASEDALHRRTALRVDYRLRRQDGTWCWVSDRGVPRFEVDREFAGFIGSGSDVTDLVESGRREAWLASFPERDPNPILELDATGHIHYANPSALALLPDVQRHGLRHPWLDGLFDEYARRQGQDSEPYHRNVTLGDRAFAQSISHLPESDRFRVYSVEITSLVAAERALARERDLLRLLVGNLPASIYVKDLAGRFVLYNRAAQLAIGLDSEDQALGKTVYDFFPKRIADLYATDDRQVFDTGQPLLDREEPTQDAQGLVRWFRTTKLPLHDDQRLIGLIGISIDVTDQLESDRKLRAHLTRLDLLRSTTHAIAQRQDLRSILRVVVQSLEEAFGAEFACVAFRNEAATHLRLACVGTRSEHLARRLGWTEGQEIAIGSNGLSRCLAGTLVHERDLAASAHPFPRQLASAGLRSLVLAPLAAEAKVFGVVLVGRTSAELFSSGECEFLAQLSEHVALASHQAELHAALQAAYTELSQSQQSALQQERLRALGQMASGVAHDLNNAIMPISLYCDALLEGERGLSTSGRDQLRIIQRAIGDVAQTITRMREFYRPRDARAPRQRVNLNLVAAQVIDLTRARWRDIPQRQGILVQVSAQPTEDLPDLHANESELREALTNLLFNAVDALPSGGNIVIRTGAREAPETNAPIPPGQPSHARLWIEVADTGVGMDEQTRRRCLEPFFSTKGDRGTGLGLAMVYGIAQRHDAEIEIESTPGRGTTVRMVFPEAPPALAAAAAPPTPLPATHPSVPLRLLVVDDDPLVGRTLVDVLTHEGHRPTHAAGGKEGIDLFTEASARREAFDAVITDLGMPRVDGLKVARAIKSLSPSTPVVLLTGWGQSLDAERNAPDAVDLVLSKPPSLQRLRETLVYLRQHLGSPPSALPTP